jgi:hypothetical protein
MGAAHSKILYLHAFHIYQYDSKYADVFDEQGYDDLNFLMRQAADNEQFKKLVYHTDMKVGHAEKLKDALLQSVRGNNDSSTSNSNSSNSNSNGKSSSEEQDFSAKVIV